MMGYYRRQPTPLEYVATTFFLAAICVGYVNNLRELVAIWSDQTAGEIFAWRMIGAFFPPIGALLGYV